MVKNWELMHEIRRLVKQLSPGEQLYLIQKIAGEINHEHFTDHAAMAREAAAMANDPDIQSGFRGEEDEDLEKLYGPFEPSQTIPRGSQEVGVKEGSEGVHAPR